MPLPAAQIFFRMPEAVTDLEVFLADADRSTRMRPAHRRRARRHGMRLIDWQRANSTLVNAVEIERNVMFLILTLIILVAAFNIISGMIMMVKDKGRDIAILRTMGASRGMILRIFMLAGASIGVLGTLAGFLLGVLFTENIEAIRQFLQDLLNVKLFAAGDLFLHPHAGAARTGRGRGGRADGAGAVVPRDALPVLARRPPRSGRGAALRMTSPARIVMPGLVPGIYVHRACAAGVWPRGDGGRCETRSRRAALAARRAQGFARAASSWRC